MIGDSNGHPVMTPAQAAAKVIEDGAADLDRAAVLLGILLDRKADEGTAPLAEFIAQCRRNAEAQRRLLRD